MEEATMRMLLWGASTDAAPTYIDEVFSSLEPRDPDAVFAAGFDALNRLAARLRR
jgi:hypothetical protein